jgi:Tfp pilus assembly protein PilW
MVSLTVGLLIMAAVLTAFTSALQTRTRRVEIETAMESYRFAAQNLTKRIKNACGIASSTTSQLVLKIPDLTKSLPNSDLTETISLSNDGNINIKFSNGSPNPVTQSLVSGIHSLEFRYGETATPLTTRIADGSTTDYKPSASNWDHVRSMKITMKLLASGASEGLTESFIVTIRNRFLPNNKCP